MSTAPLLRCPRERPNTLIKKDLHMFPLGRLAVAIDYPVLLCALVLEGWSLYSTQNPGAVVRDCQTPERWSMYSYMEAYREQLFDSD